MKVIKKILRVVLLGVFLLLAACSSKNPISASNIPDLVSTKVLQSTEALTAQWTLDGKAFWLQGFGTASLYDSKTLQEKASYDVGEDAALYDVSPDGKNIAFASSDDPTIVLYDVIAGQETAHIPLDMLTQQALFSPDGKVLGTISPDIWEITLWDTTSAQISKQLTGFETAAPVYSFQFGADGKTVMWIARATIQPMDIESAELGPRIEHEDFISASALSPDGNLLATAAAGTVNGEFLPIVTIWDAHSGESLVVFTNQDYFNSLTFSPDGSLLTAGSNGTVLFWDTTSYTAVGQITTGTGYVNSIQFSPDGAQLITCTSEGSVQLWHVEK